MQNVRFEDLTREPVSDIPQECVTRVSHKSVPPYKSVVQECPQKYPRRVSDKTVPRDRVPYKSVRQECPSLISVPQKSINQSVAQTCSRRVS